MKKIGFIFFSLVLVSSVLIAFSLNHKTAEAQKPLKILRILNKKHHKSVCDFAANGRMRCNAHVVTDDALNPSATASPSAASYGPVQFHTAYNFPCTPGGPIQSVCATPNSFGPQIIAIVDAYHSPNIENDLNVYSNYFGIPLCTKTSGCLTVLNQNGSGTLPQIVDSGWTLETALDVETAHALCQTCRIMLLEASSNKFIDLATAVNSAAHLGATVISNSYGGSEWAGELNYDGYFNHPGTAILFATGDNGYGVEYPASSPNVTAVGGTTLQTFTDNTYASESAWVDSGSGCSLYEPATTWQLNLPNWSQLGCYKNRAIADIAADADPNTGAAIYDSTAYNGSSGWWQVGGTSLATPIIASAYALHGGISSNSIGASVPYVYFTSANSHDILTGTNGICVDNMCQAHTGYDGPTGLGSPNGLTGFGLASASSSITPTPIQSGPTPSTGSGPSATPTLTPTPAPTQKDITPPVIAITYPTTNSTIVRRTFIGVTANASDNIGVTKVVFSRNGGNICTIKTGIYTCTMYTANNTGTSVTYKATAYDAAGNTASSTVTIPTK